MNIGKVRGYRNNNPGNIERTSDRWQGMSEDQSGDPRFIVFDRPKWGIRAIARTLITYQDSRRAKDGSEIDSAYEIIERWAPEEDGNNADAYANFIASKLKRAADDETLDVYDYETMKTIVTAIITMEIGSNPYDPKVIDNGLRLAGIDVPVKELKKSRTMAASTVAGGATLAGGILDQIDEAKDALSPLVQYADIAQYGLIALTLLAVGVVVWARIDDKIKEES